MGLSMIINMAIMLAINVAFMVVKSVKNGRRKRRLEEIKKIKIENHKRSIEILKANKTFGIKNGLKQARKQFTMVNGKYRKTRDLDSEIEVKVPSHVE